MTPKKLLTTLAPFAISAVLCTGLFIHSSAQANATSTADDGYHPSPEALKFAINGYQWALDHNQVTNANILTVVDFNKPSYEKRLWVINLKNDHILMYTYVSQGKNSGPIYATHFSNEPQSLASSPGIFTTGGEYIGQHGHSLRMNGLEAGINNNAFNREIVMHPASYVTSSFIKANGYAGRSWGCFAVSPRVADKMIATLKNGTVLFADAPVEKNDPRVNHALSYEGQRLYDNIMNLQENPISRFFHWL